MNRISRRDSSKPNWNKSLESSSKSNTKYWHVPKVYAITSHPEMEGNSWPYLNLGTEKKLRVPKVRELMTKQFANPIDKFLNLNIVWVGHQLLGLGPFALWVSIDYGYVYFRP